MTNLKPNWLKHYISRNKRDSLHELEWLKDESSRMDPKEVLFLQTYLKKSIQLSKLMLKKLKDEGYDKT